MITRDELRARVRAKLLENGTSPDLVARVLRPGFFVNDDGLEVFAKALGVLGAGEQVTS